MPAAAKQDAAAATRPRSSALLVLGGVLALVAFIGFVALGNWQVHRRSWKLALIAKVDQRLQTAAIAAPLREQWPAINAADDEYLKVCVDGVFLPDHSTRVQAVTRLGPGDWLLQPLRTTDGDWVMINRGFVEAESDSAAASSAASLASTAASKVCGLLRMSEPGGGFLRHNDPAAGHWYSRDIAAIAAAQGLPAAAVAPYFIDADAAGDVAGGPVGGLTVVSFHNSHLVYAITWYGLALMVLGAATIVARHELHSRRGHQGLK